MPTGAHWARFLFGLLQAGQISQSAGDGQPFPLAAQQGTKAKGCHCRVRPAAVRFLSRQDHPNQFAVEGHMGLGEFVQPNHRHGGGQGGSTSQMIGPVQPFRPGRNQLLKEPVVRF